MRIGESVKNLTMVLLQDAAPFEVDGGEAADRTSEDGLSAI